MVKVIKAVFVFLLIFVFLTESIPPFPSDAKNHDISLKNVFIPLQENHPPFPPVIEGPVKGKVREVYQYNFTVDDPDGDFLLKMEIDFGEGKILTVQEEACGCKKPWWRPNTTVYVFHKWRKPGEYLIRARVMDIWSEWSNWSTLSVNMERKIPFSSLLETITILGRELKSGYQHSKPLLKR